VIRNLLKMALRNVERKKLRMLATLGAMGLAGALVIFFGSMMHGYEKGMVANLIEGETGHLQAHAAGYRLDPELYGTLDPGDGLEKLRAEGIPATARLLGFGLAAKGDASSGAELTGLDLEHEGTVSRLPRALSEGQWLDAADPQGVVLGRKLAKRLEAGLGDEVVILTQDAEGGMADRIYKVRGILKTVGARVDDAGFFMGEAAFRDIFALPAGWHEVAVKLPEAKADLEAGRRAVQAALPGAEVKTWRELQPMAASMVDSQSAGTAIFTSIAYLACALVVFNAMLMSVFERIREFGVMRALGLSPWQLYVTISLEALFEGVGACLLALLMGLPLSLRMQTHGLDLRFLMKDSASFGGLAFDPILTTWVTPDVVWPPLAALMALSLVAVAWPAWKASRMDPVEAMRHR
jgi:ABC-type lipoprotein release transport system permease subunit